MNRCLFFFGERSVFYTESINSLCVSSHKTKMADIPTVVSPQYVSGEHTKLTVAKKILGFNDGNFVITDNSGNTLFKLDHKKVMLRELTVLRDAGDSPVVSIHKKSLSLHDTYEVFRGESRDGLFVVKDKNLRDGNEETYEVILDNASEPDFEVKGDFVRRNYHIIFRGSEIVAEVAKKHFSLSGLMSGGNKYGVSLNPNVDQAFVAAVVVIMEAIHNKGKEDRGDKSSSDSD
ncbi:hypothetical protein R1flu_000446 [Riccia fluitans]|uniref:Tubby C-terminal-like domain-containing protein n=1 Tax=Riccia fluitans TaxID=41844 RepID=A0ABD1Y0H4_9MARC